MPFAEVGEIRCDPERGRVFEHGWQSWSPTGSYRLGETPPRPADRNVQTICYRPETPAPDGVFQGEGLLAIDPGDGPVEVWSAPGPLEVPSIRARPEGDRLVVSADGPVRHTRAADLDTALRDWATTTAAGHVPEAFPAVPPMWCTWYGYWDKVTETDVLDNLRLLERHGLTADMILVDDGYEAGIGDWLDPRPGFGSLERAVGAVTGTGRRAGIWTAPFLAATRAACTGSTPTGWWAAPTPAACGTRTSPSST